MLLADTQASELGFYIIRRRPFVPGVLFFAILHYLRPGKLELHNHTMGKVVNFGTLRTALNRFSKTIGVYRLAVTRLRFITWHGQSG
jgi:hypothetical protein